MVSNLKEKELPSPICPKEFTGSESDSGIKSESGSSVKVKQYKKLIKKIGHFEKLQSARKAASSTSLK